MSFRDDNFEMMNEHFEMMNRLFEQMQVLPGATAPRHTSSFATWDGDDASEMPSADSANTMTPVSRGSSMTPFGARPVRIHGRGASRPVGPTIDTNIHVEPTDDSYVVMVDLPGFGKDDLSVRFQDRVLTIEGEMNESEESESVSYRKQRRVFEQFTLPEAVLADDIDATYRNGVLEIVVPTEDGDDEHHVDIDVE